MLTKVGIVVKVGVTLHANEEPVGKAIRAARVVRAEDRVVLAGEKPARGEQHGIFP